jgi:hypothetical protein
MLPRKQHCFRAADGLAWPHCTASQVETERDDGLELLPSFVFFAAYHD